MSDGELNIRESTRCSDADRSKVMDHLRWAHGRGYLTGAEMNARLEVATNAVEKCELGGLRSDLVLKPDHSPDHVRWAWNGVQVLIELCCGWILIIATIAAPGIWGNAPHPSAGWTALCVSGLIGGVINAVIAYVRLQIRRNGG